MNAGMFGGSKVLGALKKALSKGRGATAADIATAVDEAAVGNEAQAGNPLDNGKPEGYAGAETMPKYPGNNPAQVPAEGYEWRGNGVPGSKQGNWYNPSTKEWLRPDLNHPGPIAPHWDYGAPDGKTYRIFPDGTFEVK